MISIKEDLKMIKSVSYDIRNFSVDISEIY